MTTSISRRLVSHLKSSNVFQGVDIKFYTAIIRKMEKGEAMFAKSNLERAKIDRVFTVYTDVLTGIKTHFRPLVFNSDCCQSEVIFNEPRMMYQCPTCKNKVSAHKDFMPKGSLACSKLSKVRQQLHKDFDLIWQSEKKQVSRNVAYKALSKKLNLEHHLTHIGNVSDNISTADYYHAIKMVKAELHLANE